MRVAPKHIEARDLDARVAALKQQRREADARALQTGRLTPAEVTRKNGLFSGRGLKLDLASSGRFR